MQLLKLDVISPVKQEISCYGIIGLCVIWLTGSFHLLHLMFDDYILYHLEQMCCTEISDEILAEIKGTPKVSSIGKDVLLPSSKPLNINENVTDSFPQSYNHTSEQENSTQDKTAAAPNSSGKLQAH